MTRLVVDVRERDLIALLDIPFETAALEVGDIHIHQAAIGETLVFERKTFADLAASIKDGRYREQKQRLTSQFQAHRVAFIMEGFPTLSQLVHSDPIHGLTTSSFISSLLSLQFRDGFHVIHTTSLEETALLLKEIVKRYEASPDKLTRKEDAEVKAYEPSVIKSCKRENMTPSLCYKMQLSQIPGISMTLAKDIEKMYPSLSVLMESIRDKKEKALTDIPGIGKKKAAVMMEYFI
jgi:crossover junction endonuclease MUS81